MRGGGEIEKSEKYFDALGFLSRVSIEGTL